MTVEGLAGARRGPLGIVTGRADKSFLLWGGGAYCLVVGIILAVSLHKTGGRLVYVQDDPAIHIAVASNLVHHGTWGVVPGHFQSASSSPLWTLLLAAYIRVFPFAASIGPLILNILAGTWVIAVIGANQWVLRPSLQRFWDVAAVFILTVGVLFLPGLTLLGMEHTLHMALVLSAVVLFHRRAVGLDTRFPAWIAYVLLGAATLARFETMFVAAGIGVALLGQCLPGWRPPGCRPVFPQQFKQALLVGAVSGGVFALFAAFNHLMGQGWLPNPILFKSTITNGGGDAFRLTDIVGRFTSDPLLAVLTAVSVGAVLVAWRQPSRLFVFPAIVLAVAVALQVTFAEVGQFERYQAYLFGLAVYVLLGFAKEVFPGTRLPPARSFVVASLVIAALVFCYTKLDFTVHAPQAVEDTYQQRYQAARFLARYYKGQPVATGELGYTSLQHRGPITDLFGLGDYLVLQGRRRFGQRPPKEYWATLAQERRFKVVTMYRSTLSDTIPDNWIHVGDWNLDRARTVTAVEPTFQFWATSPQEVRPLEAHLKAFQNTKPPGVNLQIDELAELRADLANSSK
jgi:hypothetical protein